MSLSPRSRLNSDSARSPSGATAAVSRPKTSACPRLKGPTPEDHSHDEHGHQSGDHPSDEALDRLVGRDGAERCSPHRPPDEEATEVVGDRCDDGHGEDAHPLGRDLEDQGSESPEDTDPHDAHHGDAQVGRGSDLAPHAEQVPQHPNGEGQEDDEGNGGFPPPVGPPAAGAATAVRPSSVAGRNPPALNRPEVFCGGHDEHDLHQHHGEGGADDHDEQGQRRQAHADGCGLGHVAARTGRGGRGGQWYGGGGAPPDRPRGAEEGTGPVRRGRREASAVGEAAPSGSFVEVEALEGGAPSGEVGAGLVSLAFAADADADAGTTGSGSSSGSADGGGPAGGGGSDEASATMAARGSGTEAGVVGVSCGTGVIPSDPSDHRDRGRRRRSSGTPRRRVARWCRARPSGRTPDRPRRRPGRP